MKKKAIIFDLDNTIFAVSSIGDSVFAPLFELIRSANEHNQSLDSIRYDLMRKPFQVVAEEYHFSPELIRQGTELLKNLTYEGPIKPFEDYKETKDLPCEKYLVTTGFFKLQNSKIKGLGIEKDFTEVHIVDPSTSDKTKKDVFADIMQRHGYDISEVLVVGDDPESEIKAAQELGADAVLYDKNNMSADSPLPRVSDYQQLPAFL